MNTVEHTVRIESNIMWQNYLVLEVNLENSKFAISSLERLIDLSVKDSLSNLELVAVSHMVTG